MNLLPPPSLGNTLLLGNIGTYEFLLGIPDNSIDEIITHSQDESDSALQKNTSDQRRFGNHENLEKWYNDPGRLIFTLISEEGKMAALWFSRPCSLPTVGKVVREDLVNKMMENSQNLHTGGIRVYPNFRGLWLSILLTKESTIHYRNAYPGAYMCIDIDEGNIPSQKSYEACGYIFIGYGENKKTVDAGVHMRRLYLETP